MQSENFDKKIKDILDQPHPGNEKPEWDRMEKMLDKYMPQKKDDNKRFLLLLLVFLLAGSGAFIIWQNANRNKHEIASVSAQDQNKEQPVNKQQPETNIPGGVTPKNDPAEPSSEETVNQKADQSSQLNRDENKNQIGQNSAEAEFTVTDAATSKTKPGKTKNNSAEKKQGPVEKTAVAPATKNETITNTDLTDANKKEAISNNVSVTNEVIKKEEEQKTIADKKVAGQKNETKEPAPSVAQKKQSGKQKRSFLNNLFITASAGADVSTVELNKAGKVKMAYGAGLGYQVSDRFSIRAGYYKGRKVYSAAPRDYDPPSNFWGYYPNIKNIDADCKVTELPVTVDYSFNRNKKQSWFVSAGVSSLFMKKEVYDYYYKPNYSPSYVTYTKTINNQNKHYFSILDLSGGYTRTIDKHFSLQAEPYIKIAMTGIGYGKVKLNSGGVLISAIYRPFARK